MIICIQLSLKKERFLKNISRKSSFKNFHSFGSLDIKIYVFIPLSTVYQAFVRYMVRSKKNLKKMRHRAAHGVFLEYWNTQKVFAAFDNVFHVYLIRGLQKYARNLISLHIFAVPSSSRHEKNCQRLQRLFCVFQYSRNTPWAACYCLLLTL